MIWSGWRDLNSRPLRPERSALTGLRYTPKQAHKNSFFSPKFQKYGSDHFTFHGNSLKF